MSEQWVSQLGTYMFPQPFTVTLTQSNRLPKGAPLVDNEFLYPEEPNIELNNELPNLHRNIKSAPGHYKDILKK